MSTLTNKDIAVRLNTAIAQDTFNRPGTSGNASVSNAQGWGTTASDGETWAGTGGGSPSYQIVTNGSTQMGQITGSVSANIKLLGSKTQANVGALVQVAFSSTLDEGGLILRQPSLSNHYRFKYTGATHFAIAKNVGGTVTSLGSASFTITANTLYWIRAQTIGTALYGKIWAVSSAEPTSWTVTAVDSAQTTGQFGVYCVLAATGDTAQFARFAVYDAPPVSRDVPSRTILGALKNSDLATRTIVAAKPLRDVVARARISATPLRDITSRLKLVTPAVLRDIASRLILSKIRNADIAARFGGAISQDTFNRTSTAGSTNSTNASGWGTATNPDGTSEGELWNGSGGGATYQITASGGNQVGQITGTTNTIVRNLGQKTILNVGAVVQVAFSSIADEGGLILRSVSGGNHYRFRYNNGKFAIARDVNSTVLSLTSANFTLTAGSFYYIRAQAIDSFLCAKIWVVGTLEPVGWTLTTTDSTQSVGQFGVYCNLAAIGDTAQFLGFAAYDAPATSRDITMRLVLRALILRDIINVRVIIGALSSHDLANRLYLVPPTIPFPKAVDIGSRLTLVPTPGNVQLGASPIQNNTFMLGPDLPMIRPTTPYQVNGVPLADLPTMATAPFATSNTILTGSTFTLLFASPTGATQTALTSGSTVSLTFALASGQMVTGNVSLVSSLTGSVFQVQATLTQNLVINTRVAMTQFL